MKFSDDVIAALGYYVYCLVDPRDGKVFYIGKGTGNRVFDHINEALNESVSNDKLDTIRDIHRNNQEVGFYIIRHNLSEKEAYVIESTLIDFLTYRAFNLQSVLTNIASGHHRWDEGIKSVEDLQATYDCKPITADKNGTLLLVSLNQSFNQAKAKGVYRRPDIYEATRKYWKISKDRAKHIQFVLGVYRGIVRSVIKVDSYTWVDVADDGTHFASSRCCFEGQLLTDSPYLNKDVSDYPFGSRGAVTYI